MKECAICGQQIDPNAIKCSNGHSVFIKPKDRFEDTELITSMIKCSTEDYSDIEISYLVEQINKICQETRQPISGDLVKKIESNLLKKSHLNSNNNEIEPIASNQKTINRASDLATGSITDNFEKSFVEFRGSMPKDLSKDDLVYLVSDAININIYNNSPVSFETVTDKGIKEYRENSIYWNDALNSKLINGDRIKLINFNVLEWVPSSPGKYFTHQAEQSRINASRYISNTRDEYIPLGKGEMILGGVGSVRLATRLIHNNEMFILCASSNGISHQGIPIILNENIFDKVSQFISSNNGCVANISGRIKIFSIPDLPITFDKQIPKFGVFVDDIVALNPSSNLLVTVAVSFSDQRNSRLENIELEHSVRSAERKWSFCSFNPSQKPVSYAVDWLIDYMRRYSMYGKPLILSDFDEHYDHFDSAVEFPITNVMEGNVNKMLLKQYQKILPIAFNPQNITIGELTVNENNVYNIGQAGAVGPNARSDGNIFTQHQGSQSYFDTAILAQELRSLITVLQQQANLPEHKIELSAISQAETEAKKGDLSRTLGFLSKVGKWSLDTATSIGSKVAAEAIKSSLGL